MRGIASLFSCLLVICSCNYGYATGDVFGEKNGSDSFPVLHISYESVGWINSYGTDSGIEEIVKGQMNKGAKKAVRTARKQEQKEKEHKMESKEKERSEKKQIKEERRKERKERWERIKDDAREVVLVGKEVVLNGVEIATGYVREKVPFIGINAQNRRDQVRISRQAASDAQQERVKREDEIIYDFAAFFNEQKREKEEEEVVEISSSDALPAEDFVELKKPGIIKKTASVIAKGGKAIFCAIKNSIKNKSKSKLNDETALDDMYGEYELVEKKDLDDDNNIGTDSQVAASVSLAPKEADVVETENPIVEISSQVPSVVSYNLEPVGKKQYGTLFDTVVFDSNFLNNLGLNDEKISNLDLNMSEFLRKIT